MRIVLHTGLHKSATTSIQSAWGQAWGEPGDVWFPRRQGASPGHSYLFRPYLSAFTERLDPDLVLVSLTSSAHRDDLREIITQAEREGVETLVLSSEDLDRLRPVDVPAILAALGEHDLTVLVSATRPAHRWCANWQTLVRRGLHDCPRAAAPTIERIAALTPGRLEALVTAWPASRVVVRLVETEPAEPGLPGALAAAVGLPEVATPATLGRRNASLGVEVDVLRRLNATGEVLGWAGGGAERIDDLRGDGFTYRDRASPDQFAVTDLVWEAAQAEGQFLRGLPSNGIELDDPGGLLSGWSSRDLPDWYDEIAQREAVVPQLETLPDLGDQLWRARQESAAYQSLLERSEKRLKVVRRRLKQRVARPESPTRG